MKPIKTKTYLIQILLISLSIMLAIIGFLLSAKSIPFFPSVEAISNSGQTQIEVAQGLMPFSHLCLYLGFLFVYLMFEFYGFKPAFYTSINMAVMMFLTYMISHLIKNIALNPETSEIDQLLSSLFVYEPRTLFSLSAATAGGFTVSLILASAIKKLTRNYFMFFRFPIASFIGFGVFSGLSILINQYQLSAYESMLLDGITPLSHFLTLILASVIPLYILRLFMGIFRGRVKDDESDSHSSDKSVFKGSHDPAQSVVIPPQPEPKQEAPQEKEVTVSQKMYLDPVQVTE